MNALRPRAVPRRLASLAFLAVLAAALRLLAGQSWFGRMPWPERAIAVFTVLTAVTTWAFMLAVAYRAARRALLREAAVNRRPGLEFSPGTAGPLRPLRRSR